MKLEAGCRCIMQKICSKDTVYAGFFARLAAWLIDWCILIPCIFLICLPFSFADFVSDAGLFSTAVLFRFTLKDILKYILALAYFVILTYYKGATVGKLAMNLRVVGKDGQRPDLFTVLYRECIGKFLSRITLCIGYLMIGADQEKAGLHDKLSDTRVIYAKKIHLYPVVHGTAARPAQTPPKPPVENGPGSEFVASGVQDTADIVIPASSISGVDDVTAELPIQEIAATKTSNGEEETT